MPEKLTVNPKRIGFEAGSRKMLNALPVPAKRPKKAICKTIKRPRRRS